MQADESDAGPQGIGNAAQIHGRGETQGKAGGAIEGRGGGDVPTEGDGIAGELVGMECEGGGQRDDAVPFSDEAAATAATAEATRLTSEGVRREDEGRYMPRWQSNSAAGKGVPR